MSLDLSIENIEIRVLLLAIYTKKEDETILEVLNMMENGGVFTKKIGKKYIKFLKQENYLTDEGLTMIGIQKAKEIEKEFKI